MKIAKKKNEGEIKYEKMSAIMQFVSMLLAAPSKAWVCGHSLAGIAGSNPTGRYGWLNLLSGVLSGRGLCDGLITHPEESYRVWCVCV